MKKIKKNKKKKKLTAAIIVYIVLRILVVVCMVAQSMRGNWHNVFLCIITLLLFTLPGMVSKKLNIALPSVLEIMVYLFIFSAEILGEIQNFYNIFIHWDTVLHTFNGFICAAIGFSLIDILNRADRFHITMTPIFVALVSFCFSMTIGVLWEFGEFAFDRFLLRDTQKDRILTTISSVKLNKDAAHNPVVVKDINKTEIYSNNNTTITTIEGGYIDIGLIDTMKDLFVNFIGAVVFSTMGYFYIKDDYKFPTKFIPSLNQSKEL